MMGVAEDPVRAPPRAAWVRGRIQELTDFLYTMWSFYVLILNYAFNFNVEHAYFFLCVYSAICFYDATKESQPFSSSLRTKSLLLLRNIRR